MDKPKIEKAAFVTNDIGNMVGCAFAAQFPARGHFNFRGPDVERLVKGRASTSTGFGMNFPPIPKRSTRQRAVTMRGSMHSPVPCIRHVGYIGRYQAHDVGQLRAERMIAAERQYAHCKLAIGHLFSEASCKKAAN